MARIRTIKPEFWTSEQVMECSPVARLLFIGLWNFCDDEGRMPFSAKRVKAQIFPSDDISSANVRRLIDELTMNGLVEVYDAENKQYLQVTGWHHQKIDRPNPSKYPGPNGARSPPLVEQSRKKSPDSGREGNPLVENPSTNKGVMRKRNARARASDPPSAKNLLEGSKRQPDDWPPDYREQFEAAYPHRVAMAVALAQLDTVRQTKRVSWHVVITALASYVETKPLDRQWANPKTWLTQERWNDRPAHVNGNARGGDAARELARELEASERALATGAAGDTIGGSEIGGDNARPIPGNK